LATVERFVDGMKVLFDEEDLPIFENGKKWCPVLIKGRRHYLMQAGYKTVGGRRKPFPIYFHRVIMGASRGQVVDHINHDSLDNRKENLRCVTPSINASNRASYKNSLSGGYRWVYPSYAGSFYARFCFQGRTINITGRSIFPDRRPFCSAKESSTYAELFARVIMGDFYHPDPAVLDSSEER
jgi:hypothetical protein